MLLVATYSIKMLRVKFGLTSSLLIQHTLIRYRMYTNVASAKQFVSAPSVVTTHPQSQLTRTGATVVLSCEATGSGSISYQWRRVNGEISSDRAEGVNTPTLTISPVTEQDEDEYYCVASSGGGKFTDTSNVAVIAVVDKNPKSNAVNCFS